jgi:F-type H+-transporting ATPase subunit delta
MVDCNDLVSIFLKLLIYKNRFECFEDIVKSYTQFNDSFTGYENLSVESAVKLAHDETETIKRLFASITRKKIKLNTTVDESLIGGLKIIYRDNVIDASIKSHLDVLKKDLMLS